jgi:hypothetical protein
VIFIRLLERRLVKRIVEEAGREVVSVEIQARAIELI